MLSFLSKFSPFLQSHHRKRAYESGYTSVRHACAPSSPNTLLTLENFRWLPLVATRGATDSGERFASSLTVPQLSSSHFLPTHSVIRLICLSQLKVISKNCDKPQRCLAKFTQQNNQLWCLNGFNLESKHSTTNLVRFDNSN